MIFILLSLALLVTMDTVEGMEARSSRSVKRSIHQNTTSALNPLTAIVSHSFCEFCLSAEDKESKRNMDDVHTYAKLKTDPNDSLPPSFTICSSLITSSGPSGLLFSLLGEDGNQWLAPDFFMYDIKKNVTLALEIAFSKRWHRSSKTFPPVFPQQWVTSCMAINTATGLIQWVVGRRHKIRRYHRSYNDTKKPERKAHTGDASALWFRLDSVQQQSNQPQHLFILLIHCKNEKLDRRRNMCGRGELPCLEPNGMDPSWTSKDRIFAERHGMQRKTSSKFFLCVFFCWDGIMYVSLSKA